MQKLIRRIAIYTVLFCLIATFVFCFHQYKKNINNKKTFTFWTIQLKSVYRKQINNIIKDFEKNHPEYKVVWVDIPIQEAQKRTLASVLSSTPPDLINLNPDFSYILAQKNVLDFFEEWEAEKYHSGLVDKLRYKGKIYGIPFYATSPVTVYNKKIFDKCLNKNFPKTYDELYNISSELQACANTSVFAASLNENDTLYKILNKYNIKNFNTQKEKEDTLKIYSMFNKMYKNNLMPKDTLTINHREVIEKYMSNQAISIVAGSNFIKMIKQNAPDVYLDSQIAPQLTGDNKKYDVSLMNLVIPKKAQNKELAREFAFLLTNKENQLELAKATNVLCANKYALNDDYIKNCPNDIEQKSRCESAKQLNNIFINYTEIKDKKALNDSINKTLEEILLDHNVASEEINNKLNILFENVKQLF